MRVPPSARRGAPAIRRFLLTAVGASLVLSCGERHPTRPPATAPLAAVNASGTPFPLEFFVQAHQDDWQLFLGDRTGTTATTAAKVVFVYTTAGDAGTAVSNPPFWQAREKAANASVDSAASALGGAWTCANPTVNGHVIKRCTKANTVSYYLRLPDGNGEGQGYSGRGSLMQLRTGAIATISAVDATTTYASWADLVATFQAIVTTEAAGQAEPNIALHVNDWTTANEGDHSDHVNTGELVKAAAAGHVYNLFWYIGYPTMNMPINLSAAEYAAKWRLVIAYDDVMKALMGETLVGTGHAEDWSRRTYYRAELSTGTPPPPPPPPTTVPVAPSALTATPVNGVRIDLAWTDNATDETGYRVERAPDSSGVAGTWAEIATLGVDATSYSNTAVAGNTRYWYRVRALNVVGFSSYSNETSAILLPSAPPSGLTANAISSSRIDLAWADNSSDEQGFRIERAADAGGVAGPYTEIATVAPDVRAYSNISLTSSTRYWYRVRAFSAAGNSAYSNEASATTPAPPTSTYGMEVYVQAHQDDWQLFLGDRTQASVLAAPKVLFVYTTSGDAGTALSNPAFWQAREASANASVDSAASTAGGAWSCANRTVSGHVIYRCAKANTVSYYLRLPDGNGDGQGYNGLGSMEQLRTGTRATLSAVNNTTTYTSWGDLVSTFQGIVAAEAGAVAEASIAVHVNDWNRTYNDGDHSDHINSGEMVKSAAVGHSFNYFWYVGYPTMNMPINLSAADYAIKWRLIIAYDDVMKRLMGETLVGTGHAEDWAHRTYYRSEPSTGVPVPAPSAPTAPTALTAASNGGASITLRWTDNAADETGFRVERATDAGGVPGTFTQIASVGANVATYSSTGLTANVVYWYRVRAYNGNGNSAYTNTASAVLAAPAAPSGLAITAPTGSSLTLGWTDNSTDEQGYRIERAPDAGGAPGTFALIASVGAGVATYTNTGLAAGTTYWYQVRAYNAVGNSAYTAAASGTTIGLPNAPTALAATPASGTRIDLAWTDNATNEQGFRIERAPDAGGVPGTFALITSVGANVTTYGNTALTVGTRYWYRVRAYNTAGNSAYTDQVTAQTFSLPLAPTDLQGSGASSTAIDLTWSDNATDETSYRLERAPDNAGVPGAWGSAVTLAANLTSYRRTGLAANTRYWFRLRAQNAVGNSAWTPAVSVSTLPYAPPSALAASAYLVGTTRNVDLTWSRGSELTVDIYRNGTRISAAVANNGGPFNNKPASTLALPITYQVCAAGKTGSANCSAVVSVTAF